MADPMAVSRTSITLSSATLSADVSSLLERLSTTGDRVCGLSIQSGTICKATDETVFDGLVQGQYSFRILDTWPPVLASFQPRSGTVGVALDGSVVFTFNEAVKLPSPALAAGLGRIEPDIYGNDLVVETVSVPVTMSATSTTSITVSLAGLLRPGLLYSLRLPLGVVVDMAGNAFAGLAMQSYTFRAVTSSIRVETTQASSGMSVGAVIGLAAGAALVVGGGTIFGVRMLRSRMSYRRHLVEESSSYPSSRLGKRQEDAPPSGPKGGLGPAMETAWAKPTGSFPHPSGATASAPPRVHPGTGTGSAPSNGSLRPPGAAARPATSPRGGAPGSPGDAGAGAFGGSGNGASGTGVHNSGTGASGASGARATGAPQPPPAAAPPQAPVVDDRCPEMRAVEKRMRDMMDQPLQVRKKTYKELLVEYHPDKNSNSYATEVFQFINNQRGWFLYES